MEQQKTRLMIGFLTYGESTAKYLPYFLYSLKEQTWRDFRIVALDNTPEINNSNHRFISEKYPQIKLIWHGKNLGFGKGYNELLNLSANLGMEYFLIINPDMLLDPQALEEMIKVMDQDKTLSAVSPKVLKWDFEKGNNKTKMIDSVGLGLSSGLSFYDLGQGEKDHGQYDQAKIIGPGGCAGLYRMADLEKIKMVVPTNNDRVEYFDELFFMYKEDNDFAYRLHLSGCKSAVVPSALIYHDRTASSLGRSNLLIALNRRNKSKTVKKWSFFGQEILFRKYYHLQNFESKFNVIVYRIKMFLWLIVFEPYLLQEIKKLSAKREEIEIKKELLKKIIK